jgi:hypothetical protein
MDSQAPKARPQCPHKAGKRAPPCSPSLVASDYLSAKTADRFSGASLKETVAPLRHNARLFGGQALSSAPFVQPPASSPSGSSARLRPALRQASASRLRRACGFCNESSFVICSLNRRSPPRRTSAFALCSRRIQGQAPPSACPCLGFYRRVCEKIE